MQGEITYFDDIVKELSEEFNMNEKEIKELCSISLDYIKQLTKEKITMAILLPYLGVLHFNRSLGNYYKNLYNKETGNQKQEIDNLEYRLEEVNKTDNKKHKKRPLLYKFKRILKRKGYDLPRVGVTIGQKEMWSTVSKMQNEINND